MCGHDAPAERAATAGLVGPGGAPGSPAGGPGDVRRTWPGGVVLTRRSLLAGTAAAAGAVLLGRAAAVAGTRTLVDLGGVPVVPRSEWGGDLAPAGPIPAEPDVRYLLVHHSVDPGNDYGEADVAGILRGFVRFHTSATKGWPDLAYNFLVDRFGRVWEGRTGSLAAPVAGDATGGNQGFDQLCCFIGNHQVADPTPAAFATMGRLLGALARRSGIPVGEGASVSFTSRGSNRHPAGVSVTTPTIAGHRDMSRTQCPGDRVVARLPELRLLAAGGGASPVPPPPPPPAPSGTAPPATEAPAPPPTDRQTTAPARAEAPASTAPGIATPPARADGAATATAAPVERAEEDGGTRVGPTAVVAGTAVAVAAAAAGAAWTRARRNAAATDRVPPDGGEPGSVDG